jgi:hypothetical protein
MTRRRRSGRPYQPLPRRQNRAGVILIVIVGLVLIIGAVAISLPR